MKPTAEKKQRCPADDALWASRCEQILDVAVGLFARHGYADTDTQLLAEKLGVGKGTLYRYFPSKRDLFLAAVDRVMYQMRQRIDDSIKDIDNPLDRIAAAIRAYLGFFVEHPDYVELLMQERAGFKDRKEPTYFQHRAANIERWRALYRGLIAEGWVRDMPVEQITDVVGALVYGTMFTNYFIGHRKAVDVQAEEILDIVFNGILTESGRQRRSAR
ncbi:MAG: TetR/AcrR family transcriptional regulator [Gemmataceae bacterium]|nr:TetR/AcrR family transcriptional regulator [Gemmataceae bacterium]